MIRLGSRRRGAWRVAVGSVLREWRTAQGLRLSDVAARAGVSVQYLSEVERGRKEPSSEVLGAVTEALGSSLSELALGVADGLRERPQPGRAGRAQGSRAQGSVTTLTGRRGPSGPVGASVGTFAGGRRPSGPTPGSVTLLAA